MKTTNCDCKSCNPLNSTSLTPNAVVGDWRTKSAPSEAERLPTWTRSVEPDCWQTDRSSARCVRSPGCRWTCAFHSVCTVRTTTWTVRRRVNHPNCNQSSSQWSSAVVGRSQLSAACLCAPSCCSCWLHSAEVCSCRQQWPVKGEIHLVSKWTAAGMLCAHLAQQIAVIIRVHR